MSEPQVSQQARNELPYFDGQHDRVWFVQNRELNARTYSEIVQELFSAGLIERAGRKGLETVYRRKS